MPGPAQRRERGARRALGATALVAALVCAFAFASTAVAAAKLGTVGGSAEQVYLTGATPGAKLTLVNRRGRVVQVKRVDRLGALIFRNVAPGRAYRVRSGRTRSRAVTVFTNRDAPVSTKGYSQRIPTSGYGYLTTRDGTKLAIDVHTPGTGKGPYPTVVEYAGYGYADPFHGPDSGIAQVANLLGFAVVDVNMRGTGCSGGAFDYFERLQSLDGYDIVETVARQPWVLHHKVGTMGISYGGISQLFLAATNPPHLAAIAPLSVIDDSRDDAVPRRDPQHRIHAAVGGRARPRCAAGVEDGRPGLGSPGDRQGRHDVQGEPGAPCRGGQPRQQDPREPVLRPGDRRSNQPDQVRQQDQGAGVHGLPVHRRADRRPLPRPRCAFHRHDPEVVHVHQWCPHRLA